MNQSRQRALDGELAFRQHAVLRWEDMVPFTEGAAEWSLTGDVLTPLFATYCGAAYVQLGPKQEGRTVARSTEHVLFAIEGTVELIVDNRHEYRLGPEDLVFIPGFVDYVVHNRADDRAVYLCLNLQKSEWPGRLFDGDQVSRLPSRYGPRG